MGQETLGQVFKRYRQADKIKIEKVEQETKISKRMLLALENDDFTILPDELYTKQLIKSYARYLSLDYNKLLHLYDKAKKNNLNKRIPKKDKPLKIYLTPQRIRNSLIALIIFSLLVYFGFQLNRIFTAPELIIITPAQDIIINENYIEIKGKTEKEARVFINEKEVFLDPQGEFQASLDLPKGINYIKISAVKKNSKANTIFRKVLVQELEDINN